MAEGSWATARDRREAQQLARDVREAERERTRLEKRMLRDLRWSAERATLQTTDWGDLLKLQQAYGKEGPMQLWHELIPYWRDCQRLNGGAPCPPDLTPAWVDQKLSAKISRTRPTTRKAPGTPRKPRTDAGKPRGPYKPRG